VDSARAKDGCFLENDTKITPPSTLSGTPLKRRINTGKADLTSSAALRKEVKNAIAQSSSHIPAGHCNSNPDSQPDLISQLNKINRFSYLK